MLRLITDREIYETVVLEHIPRARKFLWLATSDLKDLYIHKKAKMVPFLEMLSDLINKQVEIRLLHAREPGTAFRADFDQYPNLIKGMERILCPRVHFKMVVVDGVFGYTGSANLTGAGMGAKSKNRRNFESGMITDEQKLIEPMMAQFDGIWRGEHCQACQRKTYCADYTDILKAR